MAREREFIKELPKSNRGRYQRTRSNPAHERNAAAMRAHPGEWQVVLSGGSKPARSGLRQAIIGGRYLAYRPAGDYEAVVRDEDVYARYVGNQ